jgi:hypothetical protein
LVGDFLSFLGFRLDLQPLIVESFRILVEDWARPEINPKYVLTSFRQLPEDYTSESFLDWYTHFCYDLQRYFICLVPFDAIVLQWSYVGLCLPGVGEARYSAMGQALFSILDRVLPKNNLAVGDCIVSLLGFRHDGFRLLHLVMTRTLPVFCPSIPAMPPRWEDSGNVTAMAKAWHTYFRYAVKTGAFFPPIQRSLLFLDSLQDHALLGVVASLKGSVHTFRDSIEEFEDVPPLPDHLTIDGMVQTITSTSSPVTTSMGMARSNRYVPVFATEASRADISIPNIQGAEFVPRLNATAARGPSRPARRSAAPRVGNGLVCRACLRKNHEEVTCRDLAKLLILTNRIARLPESVKKQVLESYYKFYGVSPRPELHQTYARELESFCSKRGVSEDDLVDFYDWDYFCAPNPQDDSDADMGMPLAGGAVDSE